jgi:hypothetical protein
LNNIVEQDHRRVKRLTGPGLALVAFGRPDDAAQPLNLQHRSVTYQSLSRTPYLQRGTQIRIKIMDLQHLICDKVARKLERVASRDEQRHR